jgi:hypothetical protein
MESNHQQTNKPDSSLASSSAVQSTDTTPTTTATASTQTHEQQPYSNDPFAPNYRHIAPWDEQKKAEWIATWPLPLPSNYWELYESAEHAEATRAGNQLRVLLRQRGLEDTYNRIMSGKDEDGNDLYPITARCFREDSETRGIRERCRKFLRDAGEGDELLERVEELWRKGDVRVQVMEGKLGVDALLGVGDVAGYNWFRLNPEMIRNKEI